MQNAKQSKFKLDKILPSKCIDSNGNQCLNTSCHTSSKKIPKSSSNISSNTLSAEPSESEFLMKLKRRLKLEEKLLQITKSGDVLAGGTLKIYGESLNPMLPYKSLLLSIDDTSEYVIREILDKYNMENEKENDYCLVKCVGKMGKETEEILQKNDSPLRILLQSDSQKECIRFKVNKRPPDIKVKYRHKVKHSTSTKGYHEDPGMTTSKQKSKSVSRSQSSKLSRPSSTKSQFNETREIDEDNNNPIYYTPPLSACKTLKQSTSELCPLPSYEETLELKKHHYLQTTGVSPPNGLTDNRDSMDSFSFSSDSQDLTYHFDEKCRVECNAILVSDMDAHLSRHLPVQITYFKSKEDLLLDSVILDMKPSFSKFHLSSAYVLHLMVADIVRLTFINRTSLSDRQLVISNFVTKVASKIQQTIVQNRPIISIQVFWLANSTEFLHLLTNNILLTNFNRDCFITYYEVFAVIAQMCFKNISMGFKDDVANTLAVLFMDDVDTDETKDDIPLSKKVNNPKTMSDLLRTLSSCMAVLQQSLVNPALIIQIISRMFNLINCWTFNYVIENPAFISSHQASILYGRIERIREWSRRRELLLAADCYLQKSMQMCELLMMDKTDIEQLYNGIVDLVQLNSLQVKFFLENYNYAADETHIPQIWIDFVVSGVNQVADKIFEEEGIEISLKENKDLNLPLLLPEDGYHVDSLHAGVPHGFTNFLERLHKEWCFFKISHQDINYDWLCYQNSADERFSLNSFNSCGLDIPMSQTSSNKVQTSSGTIRHQLKLTDFKANILDYSDDKILSLSSTESGIEVDRSEKQNIIPLVEGLSAVPCGSNVHPSKSSPSCDSFNNINIRDFKLSSEACSTAVPSIVSDNFDDDFFNTHLQRFQIIRQMRENVEKSLEQTIRSQERFESIAEDVNKCYEERLQRKLIQFDRVQSRDFQNLQYQQQKLDENRNHLFQTYKAQKEAEMNIQSERIRKISELEAKCSGYNRESRSNVFSSHIVSGSQPPTSFVSTTLALNNSVKIPPKTKPKPRNRSHSIPSIPKQICQTDVPGHSKFRSRSSDRYYMSALSGTEQLSFQEKVDFFEYGIHKSSH